MERFKGMKEDEMVFEIVGGGVLLKQEDTPDIPSEL